MSVNLADVVALCSETPVEREIREEREQNLQALVWGDFWRAVMLAPRVEICVALLRGESVPVALLDQEWASRFGRRAA